MNRRLTPILPVVSLLFVLASGCPSSEPQSGGVALAQGEAVRPSDPTPVPTLPGVASSLEPVVSACDLVMDWSIRPVLSGMPVFSLLQRVKLARTASGTLQMSGAMDIGHSPRAHAELMEFKVPTRLEYLNQSYAAYRAGKLSYKTYKKIRKAYSSDRSEFDSYRFGSVNGKLVDRYPGLYGDGTFALDGSWPGERIRLALQARGSASGSGSLDLPTAEAALTAQLPLFLSTRWSEEVVYSRAGLSAAVAGLRSSSPNERLCGMVLAERSFAQLLAIRGYLAPELLSGSNPTKGVTKKLRRLGVNVLSWPEVAHPGAWFDADAGKNIVLSAETIADYTGEPLLTVTKETPDLLETTAGGDLSDELALLEMLITHDEAFNLAAPWTAELPDFESTHAGARPLLWGMTEMIWSNLERRNLVPVDSRNVATLFSRRPRVGLVLVTPAQPGDPAETPLRITDATRLARAIFYEELMLARFALPTDAERERLATLHAWTPEIAYALGIFARSESPADCHRLLNWNSRNGRVVGGESCAIEELSEWSVARMLMTSRKP